MSVRKPLMEKSINSNIDQALNFSFEKSTQKKGCRTQSLQVDEGKKRPMKQKQVIDLFLGQLKEHNHEKMIQMFGELRKQNKEKQQKNQLLLKQVQEIAQEFKQVKLEYGRCLKQKTRLQQELTSQSRQLNISQTKTESHQRQLKELQKKQEENLYYKSQLFEANEKIIEYKKKLVEPDETVENEREFKFKEMQWTYEMKLDECEQHIKELQKQNWELGQIKIRNQTQVKKLNIELNQANIQLKKLSQSPYTYINPTHKKLHSADHSSQQVQSLNHQIQELEKQLQFTIETYELKLVQLQSQVDLEKFKTQTYAQHSHTLQERLNLLQNDLNSFKQQSHILHEKIEKQQSKTLDFDTLFKEVLFKLKQIGTGNPILVNYSIILSNKIQRISGGKPVTFLNNDTKDFVSITSRSKDSQSYGPHSLTSKLNQQLKTLKTHQKMNTFNSEQQHQQRESFRSNYTSIKKNQENGYFSRNSQLSDIQVSRSSQNNEKFNSKILEERKQIQNRIREKYMKSRPKGLNEKSNLKGQSIQQQLKQSSISSEEEKSPHFRRQDRQSIYLTSDFQQ